ncbi:MAG: DUF1731 domain-containing protein [Fimbriimonadaceae bacterium]
MPWIGLNDHVSLARYYIERQVCGPVNAVASCDLTNEGLMSALRMLLRRPAVPALPTSLLRLAGHFGFPAEAALFSKRAVPSVAQNYGFQWAAPKLDDLLGNAHAAKE